MQPWSVMARNGRHLPQALAVKQFMVFTLDEGFLLSTMVTMLIRKLLVEYRMRRGA